MRRAILILAAAGLAACDSTTEAGDITLDDLPGAPPNTAVVAVTEDLLGVRDVVMEAGELYYFELRTPAPLPQLLYDAVISSTAPHVRVTLASTTETGTFTTGVDGVELLFGAPDGTVYEPRTTCRINILQALDGNGIGRLRGTSDCPVTDGTLELRVLVKFDHSAG